jgi:ATP-dependent DNA ligase
MANAQAAQPVKKKATKIAPRKASAGANSTFVLAVHTPPMEARTADVIPCDGERWQYEPKWDGFRCLAFKSRDAIDLRAKSGSHSDDTFRKSYPCCATLVLRNSSLTGNW